MKKAISGWSFAAGDIRARIRLAARAGYEGIELSMSEDGEISPHSTPAELAELKSYAEEQGVEIHSLCSDMCWQYSFAGDDAGEREKAEALAAAQLEAAGHLGAGAVLMVPGSVHSALRPGIAPVAYDVAWQRNLEAFTRLKKKAESAGVCIGIENVWNKIFLSPLELRDFLDRLDSPFVGAYFDVGNVMTTGFPQHWIQILGSRIKRVHFKDYRSSTTGFDGFVDLLAGEVDWPAVTQALRQAGYDGWCTAEMIPPYTHYPEVLLYNTSRAMDSILGRPTEKE